MISIVIPMHNEQEVLLRLYGRLTRAAQGWEDSYEVVAVDDGSSDATGELLGALHLADPRWKVLSFSRNFGHQAAVSAGIHYSSGDAVVVIDADLQDPPEEIGRLITQWKQGYEVVYAVRTNRKENGFKRLAYAMFYRLQRCFASIEIPLDAGDFCLMDRAVVDVMRSLPERSRFVRGLRSWAGFRQIGVTYERQARQAGHVKYSLRKLTSLALDGLLSFSNLPLKVASWVGMAFCLGAIALIAVVIVWWASDVSIFGMHPRNAVGWTSLSALVLFVAGTQMLVTGIIGEYVARIFDEVKVRPPWIISEALGIEPAEGTPPIGWHASSGISRTETTTIRQRAA